VALDDVLGALRCPFCAESLQRQAGALRCGNGHAFDIARQGYATLEAAPSPHVGDSAEMVAARERFLSAGHFDALASSMAASLAGTAPPPGPLLELGAGTGHYLAAVLDALPDRSGIAIEISRHAAQRAARAHPRIGVVRCDAWSELPIRDGAVAGALSAFSPRNEAELARVISPGGSLAVLTPTPDHLGELTGPLGLIGIEDSKSERLARRLEPWFEPGERRRVESALTLTREQAADLAAMGPSARHLDGGEAVARAGSLAEPIEAHASVELTLYRRR
jgi:23S rRNA (guanine745-N1)-methyltransferase